MLRLETKITNNVHKVLTARDKAQFKNLSHAVAGIRKDAMASIEKDKMPSEPGQPPHTRGKRKRNLRSAMLFDVPNQNQSHLRRHAHLLDAIIGPRFSFVGKSGRAHEFGEKFKGTDFEERPFMLPALMKNLTRFADAWEGSIG